jgi:hypothetical protein
LDKKTYGTKRNQAPNRRKRLRVAESHPISQWTAKNHRENSSQGRKEGETWRKKSVQTTIKTRPKYKEPHQEYVKFK